MDTLGRFFAFFTNGDTRISYWPTSYKAPLEMWSALKNISCFWEAFFFPSREYSCWYGRQKTFCQCCLPCKCVHYSQESPGERSGLPYRSTRCCVSCYVVKVTYTVYSGYDFKSRPGIRKSIYLMARCIMPLKSVTFIQEEYFFSES